MVRFERPLPSWVDRANQYRSGWNGRMRVPAVYGRRPRCRAPRCRALDSSTIGCGVRPTGKISEKWCLFSAVSAPSYARKYAFCSIFQNLPDYQTEFFEIWQKFANFATFAKCLLIFTKIADFSIRFFAKILRLQRCKSIQIL